MGPGKPLSILNPVARRSTATSITSLTLTAGTNGIGAGSRFQLYKRVAPIIYDYTVTTAMTSLDITGLSIDKGSEYMLVGQIINASGSGSWLNLYANANLTKTNYYSQYLYATSTSVSALRSNDARFEYSTTGFGNIMIAKIKLTNNGYIITQSDGIAKYGSLALELFNSYITSTFTATSITSLTIGSDVANVIGIGSRFKIIKLR